MEAEDGRAHKKSRFRVLESPPRSSPASSSSSASAPASYLAEQERRRESGKTGADRIADAQTQFKALQGHEFKFMRCWEILKGTNKWLLFLKKSEDDEVDSGEARSPRPIGRDSAKRRRSDGAALASSSACLELFQRMAMSREVRQEQEAAWAKDHSEAQQRKLALQEEQTRIQREQMIIQREQWNWAQFEHESKIMLMDLSQCTEAARLFFQNKQQEILQRQLNGAGSSGHKGAGSSGQQ